MRQPTTLLTWLDGSAVRRVRSIPHSRKNLMSALSWSPCSPHTSQGGGGAVSGGEQALPSAQLLWAGLVTAPSQGVSWRHLCCRPYLEGTGDGSGTFLNSVIISQERLRPRGPSQARMWPLALQTAAQSTPPAGCHWLHRVPRWVGKALGFPALVKTERWGWREGDRGRWHSEMQAAVLQAEVDTPMAIKPGPPLAWTPLLGVWPSWPL